MIDTTLSTLTGAFGWALAEHLIHDKLGHKYAKNRNFFAVEHVRHHATTSYFAPSWKKAGAAAITALAVGPIACAIAGRRKGLAFTTGLVGAYVSYEVLHRWAHTRAPSTRYGRWLRKHHFHHHFHDPASNHGVTSPIFDHLFGSYQAPTRIRVPARHAMPWLIDEAGDIRPEHAADYELVQKKAKRAEPRSAARAA
jgi:hypothetical protein